MRPRLILSALVLLASFAAPGIAMAQPEGAQPLDRLLPEIRRTVPGQFLDAEGINRNGAPGYRLKWLTPEGRVIERDIDARTGRMMGPPRPGFGPREQGAPAQGPRGNFFPRNDEAGGPPGRGFGPGRFNRPGFGEGGFGNRSERFGGAEAGEGRRFGQGRARGRRED